MNISDKELDLIELYLQNRLRLDERRALEKRMEEEEGFRQQVEFLRQVFTAATDDVSELSSEEKEALANEIEALEGDPEVKQLIADFEAAELKAKPAPQPATASIRSLGRWRKVALAACFAVLISLGLSYYAYQQHSHRSYLYAGYRGTEPVNPDQAGADDFKGINKVLLEGERLLFNANFEEAEAQLDEVLRLVEISQSKPEELTKATADSLSLFFEEATYFKSQVYFQQEKYRQAWEISDSIQNGNLVLHKPEVKWHYILARLGDKKNIDSELELLSKDTTMINTIRESAQKLKVDLKRRPFLTWLGDFVDRIIN